MFTLVIPIDKAVPLFAQNVITLLAVPPGQVSTRITPQVRATSNFKTLHNKNSKSGINIY